MSNLNMKFQMLKSPNGTLSADHDQRPEVWLQGYMECPPYPI